MSYRFVAALCALMSLIALAFLSIFPLGRHLDMIYLVPFLALAFIFFWIYRHGREGAMPLWVACLGGFVFDLLGGGPFGFWALLFVLAHALATSLPQWTFVFQDWRWLCYLAYMSIMSALVWAAISLYHIALSPYMPFLKAYAIVVLGYPFILFIFRLFRFDIMGDKSQSYRSGSPS